MVKITILEVGLVPASLRERFGSLPGMFMKMIAHHQKDVEFDVVSVVNGESLPELDDIESLLITGSSYGAYEEIPWKADLEDLIRAVYARKTPMVGVCFGHQIIAQALGGTVQKADQGWGLGRHIYNVQPGNGLIDLPQLAIACSHQDQVLKAPAEATPLLSSDFAPYAGLLYANGSTLTFQPHPEFDRDYAYELCVMRQGIAPDDVVKTAEESLDHPLDGDILGDVISRLLVKRLQPAE